MSEKTNTLAVADREAKYGTHICVNHLPSYAIHNDTKLSPQTEL